MNALLKTSLIVALAAAGGPPVFAGPPKAPAVKPPPPRSVFVMPASPREGRDPFYPDSLRPYEDNNPAAAKHALDATTLTVKGFSIENGRAMVIINNHTFAVGDEGDVLTPGGRAHIRLAEIRPNSVVVEINGTRRELTIGTK